MCQLGYHSRGKRLLGTSPRTYSCKGTIRVCKWCMWKYHYIEYNQLDKLFKLFIIFQRKNLFTFTHTSENRFECSKRAGWKAYIIVKEPPFFACKTHFKAGTLSTAGRAVFIDILALEKQIKLPMQTWSTGKVAAGQPVKHPPSKR